MYSTSPQRKSLRKRKLPETESPSIAELELSVNRFSSGGEGNGKERNQWRHIFTAVKRSLNSSSSKERLRNGIIDIMPWCFRDGSCPQTIQSKSKLFRRIFSDPLVQRSISDTKFGNWWIWGENVQNIKNSVWESGLASLEIFPDWSNSSFFLSRGKHENGWNSLLDKRKRISHLTNKKTNVFRKSRLR